MPARATTNIVTLLQILLTPFNEVEQAYNDLLRNRSIDTGVGNSLDIIGRIVGQPRIGLAIGDDDTYRRYLRARVLVNRSDGSADDLIGVVQAALSDYAPALNVHVYPGDVVGTGIAMIVVQLEGVFINDTIATVLLDLLRAAASGGVRVILRYGVSTYANAFRLDSGPGLDVGHLFRGVDAG
jgi:hypothetical protein